MDGGGNEENRNKMNDSSTLSRTCQRDLIMFLKTFEIDIGKHAFEETTNTNLQSQTSENI